MKKQFNIRYTPTELWEKTNEFFKLKRSGKVGNTQADLLLYLQIGTQKWKNYCRDPKYKDATEFAKLQFQRMYEHRLENDKNTYGAIFALKNLGWSDKQDVNVALETDLTIEQVVKGGKMKA